jgi:hypothetical protein
MRLSVAFVALIIYTYTLGSAHSDNKNADDDAIDDDWAVAFDQSLGGQVPAPRKKPLTLKEARANKCNMQPPFLYLTYHDAGKVTKFTRDGCFIEDQVLRGPILGPGRPEFRQMALGPYRDMKNVLYIAQGHADQPQIMVFGECVMSSGAPEEKVSLKEEAEEREDGLGSTIKGDRNLKDKDYARFLDSGPVKTGQREMIAIITANQVEKELGEQFGEGTSWTRSRAAKHAFGLAIEFDPHPMDMAPEGPWEGPLYASFQHTDIVMRFAGPNLTEAPLPPALATSGDGTQQTKPYYNGTFHQFGQPGKHPGHMPKVSQEEQGVRGVIVCGTNVWIANENIGGILVLNKISGLVEQVIQVVNPISMFHYRVLPADELQAARGVGGDLMGDNLVYVSSKKKGNRGKVLAIADDSFQVVREYHCDGMAHPAGLTVYNKILYVVEQFQEVVHSFDTVSGKYLGTIIDKKSMPYDRIEHIALSPC